VREGVGTVGVGWGEEVGICGVSEGVGAVGVGWGKEVAI
jgi:hypothetical protein